MIDKDRALEARDERIATLQSELDQKLGALQKLNAMDLSLQGLDSKMSERLRRSDAPVDQTEYAGARLPHERRAAAIRAAARRR